MVPVTSSSRVLAQGSTILVVLPSNQLLSLGNSGPSSSSVDRKVTAEDFLHNVSNSAQHQPMKMKTLVKTAAS